MARIAGVDIPNEKNIGISLTYIYGIGRPTAAKILAEAGIDPLTRVKNLTESKSFINFTRFPFCMQNKRHQ